MNKQALVEWIRDQQATNAKAHIRAASEGSAALTRDDRPAYQERSEEIQRLRGQMDALAALRQWADGQD